MEKDIELAKEDFDIWWEHALTPEDASEFVHIYMGSELEARMVYALYRISVLQNRNQSSSAILDAYLIAASLPTHRRRETVIRQEAQAAYTSPATQFLLDRVKFNERKMQEDRIAVLAMRKIESLFTRSEEESRDKLRTEQVALDSAAKFVSISQRDRLEVDRRRAEKMYVTAIEQSKKALVPSVLPPTKEEAKEFVVKLRELFNSEEIAEILSSDQKSLPPASPSTEVQEVIESADINV